MAVRPCPRARRPHIVTLPYRSRGHCPTGPCRIKPTWSRSSPSLRLSNGPFTSYVARRLCITQTNTSPPIGLGDAPPAGANACRCTNCGKLHVNAHYDNVLGCYEGGNLGCLPSVYKYAQPSPARVGCFLPSDGASHHALEPRGVDPFSGKRPDGRCDSILGGGRSLWWDLCVCIRALPSTAETEAAFPGLAIDHGEADKTRKHAHLIAKHRPGDRFVHARDPRRARRPRAGRP